MICFPNAKINLGLNVTARQPNGYHTIETIFYPVPLTDALEAVPSEKTKITETGIPLDSKPEENLVLKAYRTMSEKYDIPPLDIYLKKAIPSGAGLGGGSADAAFMLKLINNLCNCRIKGRELEIMATSIGADCPFFIRNIPVIATGMGNVFKKTNISLKGFTLYVVKPNNINVSTKEAYATIEPKRPENAIESVASLPVSKWRNVLTNDFEPGIFKKYPIIEKLKETLYDKGAIYASMSGSGAAVFGLFKTTISLNFYDCFVWKGTLG